MNFISTFDELNKLYEEKTFGQTIKLNKRSLKEAILDDLDDALYTPGVWGVEFVGEECICFDNEREAREYFAKLSKDNISSDSEGIELFKVIDTDGTTETIDSISVYDDELTEAADEKAVDIIDDEAPVEEDSIEDTEIEIVDDEPKQVILECDKCGALVIKDEADIVVDEKTDLANVEEECQFCEEAKGFKIVGAVAPYEIVEEPIIEESLADVGRKIFDKSASLQTQQKWEETIFDLEQELAKETDPKKKAKIKQRIKQFQDKFAQQRDWEARHAKND